MDPREATKLAIKLHALSCRITVMKDLASQEHDTYISLNSSGFAVLLASGTAC